MREVNNVRCKTAAKVAGAVIAVIVIYFVYSEIQEEPEGANMWLAGLIVVGVPLLVLVGIPLGIYCLWKSGSNRARR